MRSLDPLLLWLSWSDRLGRALMRLAIAIVFIWIGAIKFAPYEADSITPFVANNPVLSQFYKHPEQYRQHLRREGEFVPAQRAWQRANQTNWFSKGLGAVEIAIGSLLLAGFASTLAGAAGAVLAFPFLSGAGQLVLKDVMLLAGSFILVIQSAKALRLRGARAAVVYQNRVPSGQTQRTSMR